MPAILDSRTFSFNLSPTSEASPPLRRSFHGLMSLQEGKTMFEQELYHNFSISSSRSYFISFAGDVSVQRVCPPSLMVCRDVRHRCLHPPPQTCQIGLNFASEEEAKRFRAAVNDLLNRRQRKTGRFLCQTANVPLRRLGLSRFTPFTLISAGQPLPLTLHSNPGPSRVWWVLVSPSSFQSATRKRAK